MLFVQNDFDNSSNEQPKIVFEILWEFVFVRLSQEESIATLIEQPNGTMIVGVNCAAKESSLGKTAKRMMEDGSIRSK